LIEGRVFKLHVWDTAGQERFQALTANYYKGAQAAVIVYDVTNRHSFERVLSWVESIDEANPGSSVAKLLVGNKADLESQRQVTTKSGAELAKKINATFVETSAKNTFNVDAAFLNLAKSLVIGK
jgi:Ras-related protein Rab-1A